MSVQMLLAALHHTYVEYGRLWFGGLLVGFRKQDKIIHSVEQVGLNLVRIIIHKVVVSSLTLRLHKKLHMFRCAVVIVCVF